ncbi:hypothetical protein HYDPIDRAFT_33140 [Hydnomerulius pinastri MD-312]|uniref:Uncharacterized protein n=1 Tax=Hydnomerulius pinastri MD-312 TaxID=994086 RepID=A0A0C9V2G4_9AGAM|nr:hypothetical protein HYDPIDRAFT_33140 [Hydnomerulius pinastri MD-312]
MPGRTSIDGEAQKREARRTDQPKTTWGPAIKRDESRKEKEQSRGREAQRPTPVDTRPPDYNGADSDVIMEDGEGEMNPDGGHVEPGHGTTTRRSELSNTVSSKTGVKFDVKR